MFAPVARSFFVLLAVVMLLPLVALVIQTPFFTPYLWIYAYIGLLTSPLIISLTQLAVAVVIAVGMGVLLSWLANSYRFFWKPFFAWVQLAPLLLTTSMLARVFEPLIGDIGIADGVRLGIYSGVSNYPLVYLLMRACLYSNNAEYWYASRTNGVGVLTSLWRVGIQLNRPALIAASLLVCMEVLSDLATPELLGINSLAMLLKQEVGIGLVSQLALVLLVALLMLVWLEKLLRGKRQFFQTVAGFKHIQPVRFSRGWQEALVLCLFAVLPTFGALVPLMLLLDTALLQVLPNMQLVVSGVVANASLALGTAFLATCVACLLVYGQRFYVSFGLRVLLHVASVGLVVPGLYLALALSLPVAWLDSWFAPLWQGLGLPEDMLGNSLGLTLYVLVVRYVAIALLILVAASAGLNYEMAFAARSLGATAARSFTGIEMRLIAPFVGVAVTLIAVLALKESGVVLVLLEAHRPSLTAMMHASLMQGVIPAHAALLLAVILSCLLAAALWFAYVGLRK